MELLPHDVVEYILERLDAKTLLKFTAVSKQWKSSIIQCRSFQTRQMLHRKQSGKTDVVLVSLYDGSGSNPNIEALRTLVVGSTVSVKIPTSWENKFYQVCNSSCDGLICPYYRYDPSIVVNPTTRCIELSLHATINLRLLIESDWYHVLLDLVKTRSMGHTNQFGYTILLNQDPVHCDGSLHWFTKGDETNILALDLHTETFQVIPRPPFLHSLLLLIESIICSIHDRLCVSERIWPEQVIWSFDSEDKTWKKIYSIDLKTTPYWRRNNIWRTFTPLSVLGKDKLLFYDGESSDGPLVRKELNIFMPVLKPIEEILIFFFSSIPYSLRERRRSSEPSVKKSKQRWRGNKMKQCLQPSPERATSNGTTNRPKPRPHSCSTGNTDHC
ncbi:hypothetical protein F2Q70_00020585 [Brassica cretica]|uniref:F-box domain-containing protein n=1 Tax=Brassica cretica TaxID=69181 RepID=A0A8S9GUZ6_BRACR|nr:hypothetical protein F2Q70_00020585 [Brassica cretica]